MRSRTLVIALGTAAGVALLAGCQLQSLAVGDKKPAADGPDRIDVGKPQAVGTDNGKGSDAIWMVLPVQVRDGDEAKRFAPLFACYRAPLGASERWADQPGPVCKLARIEGQPADMGWPGRVHLEDGRLSQKPSSKARFAPKPPPTAGGRRDGVRSPTPAPKADASAPLPGPSKAPTPIREDEPPAAAPVAGRPHAPDPVKEIIEPVGLANAGHVASFAGRRLRVVLKNGRDAEGELEGVENYVMRVATDTGTKRFGLSLVKRIEVFGPGEAKGQ